MSLLIIICFSTGPLGNINSATLKNVNLSSNRLSGPLPANIGHCAVIDLSDNMFSGISSSIQSWGNYIEIVDISSNLLTGTLPNQTSQFLRLSSLRISNNSLEGVLPHILGSYPELRTIDFSLNHFSGLLLPSLFNSTRLTDINMSFNNFSGTIPIESLTTQNLSLVSLDLSHNALTGHLPPELGEFQNLVYLDLSNNDFEGNIPDGLPNALTGFNVSYNNLSGSVPKNLQRFPLSAFHPGNAHLTLQYESFSPLSEPNMNLRGHGSHMKSTIKTALIAGLVGGASTIVFLTLIIYCKFHHQEDSRSSSNGVNKKKGIQQILSTELIHLLFVKI